MPYPNALVTKEQVCPRGKVANPCGGRETPRLRCGEVMSPRGVLFWEKFLGVLNVFVENKEESLRKIVESIPIDDPCGNPKEGGGGGGLGEGCIRDF